MNGHYSRALLESALSGQLPAEEEASLHRHLESCEACGQALEQMAGGAAWSRETAALLGVDEFDAALPGRDDWSEIDFSVEHLEPSDEPGVLGRLGGYDVLEIIGRGGMGVVLKAFDRELNRTVAIKVLAPHLAHSAIAKKRFTREAQAAAAVVHPHVLAIHQVQSSGSLPFLVMPLVSGESLAQRLAKSGNLELKEVLRIGMQAAEGLAAAHEQGLVHRDVKPANILLERGVERAVLTDFGLARAADDLTLTRYGVIAGTPQYMSPEQARGEALDGRSDLFSLGCVLYEMATGVSPFRADSMIATLRRLIDDPPPALSALNPELPPWFVSIVERLLRKDPAERFGSANELADLLERCLAHVQQPASVSLPSELAVPLPGRRKWVSRTRILGALTMLSVSIVALCGLWLSADPPDIAGEWKGDGWGQVVLTKSGEHKYTGTYSDTFGGPGKMQIEWSAARHHFSGKWGESDDRFGKIVIHLDEESGAIHGGWTADAKSKINPGTPELSDLTWTKVAAKPAGDSPTAPDPAGASSRAAAMYRITSAQRIGAVAISPDGALVAFASYSDTEPPLINIRGPRSVSPISAITPLGAEEIEILKSVNHPLGTGVKKMQFSPDGKRLAVAVAFGQVKLFDVQTGALQLTLDDEPGRLASPDSSEKLKPLKRAMGYVASLSFSPDGKLLVTAGESFDDFDQSFDGRERLGLGRRTNAPGRLKVWDLSTGAIKHDLAAHTHVTDVAFSTNGSFASAGRWSGVDIDGSGVIVWNADTGEPFRKIAVESNGSVTSVAFSPDGRLIAFCSWNFDKDSDERKSSTLHLAHARSGLTEWSLALPRLASVKDFAANGKYFIVATGKSSLRLVDADTGKMGSELLPPVAFAGHADGRIIGLELAPAANTCILSRREGEQSSVAEVWQLGNTSGPVE